MSGWLRNRPITRPSAGEHSVSRSGTAATGHLLVGGQLVLVRLRPGVGPADLVGDSVVDQSPHRGVACGRCAFDPPPTAVLPPQDCRDELASFDQSVPGPRYRDRDGAGQAHPVVGAGRAVGALREWRSSSYNGGLGQVASLGPRRRCLRVARICCSSRTTVGNCRLQRTFGSQRTLVRATVQVTLHWHHLQGTLEVWATIRSSRKARASTV
jgi:hypothetical protein